jgi:hypothetical protein
MGGYKSHAPVGIRAPDLPFRSLVTIPMLFLKRKDSKYIKWLLNVYNMKVSILGSARNFLKLCNFLCRTTYLLAYPATFLKDGWSLSEGWIREAELRQFVCKQSVQTVFHLNGCITLSEERHPTLSPAPTPVVMAINSSSARMDLGLKITFLFYLDSVLFRHFFRL